MAHITKSTRHKTGRGEAQKALESAFATSFRVLKWAMYVVLVALLFSGSFWVQEEEKAIVLRFGRLRGVYEPGFHFGLPYPIDEVRRVSVGEIKSIELANEFWYQEGADASTPMPLIPSLKHGYTLTSDKNIIHSKWLLTYHVADPVKYLLEIENGEQLLTEVLNNAIIEASARYTVKEATQTRKEVFREAVNRLFVENLRKMGHAETFTITDIEFSGGEEPTWPLQTAEAFNDVIRAETELAKEISKAEGEERTILNEAGGAEARALVKAIENYRSAEKGGDAEKTAEAKKIVDELLSQAGGRASDIIATAERYKKRLASEAQADARQITELKALYRDNPGILFKERLFELYAELLENRVLYILPETTDELRILVNPDPDVERERRQEELLKEIEVR